MSLLSGFNVTLPQVGLLGEAAMAAFAGGVVPAGWNVITPQQLGVPPQYWDGNYFTNHGASAIVLQQGNAWIVSFRGTDGSDDILSYPELVLGTYINQFQPLLNAVASNAPNGTNFYFTGASLGGGATNQMANIAGSQYGGEFASATFVAFASPNISTANGILNIGFENDPIYKALAAYNDFSSSLDHLVLATSQYMQGNYDGVHPPDYYAHNAASGFDAFARLQSSVFLDQMSPDSVVIFDAFSGTVQDITPGRENTGVFYIGENVADTISGRNGGDHIEGFGGNDVITGGGGNDVIDGGAGYNTAVYSGASAQYSITASGSTFIVADTIPGRDGTDTLTNIEHLQFSDHAINLPILGSMATFPFTGDAMSQIEAIYIGYYGRAGDPDGTSYWTNQLLNGGSTVQTMTGIAASYSVQPESQAQYPFLANPLGATTSGAGNDLDQFINSAYQNLFGRGADGTDTSGGLGYWRGQILNALATHDSTRLANELGSFILQVADGAQNTGAGQDQTVLANKVTVADAITQTFSANNIHFGNDGSAADQFAHTDIASVTVSAASVTAAEVAIIGIINPLV